MRWKSHPLKICTAAVLLACACIGEALGQQAVSSATLRGRVEDASAAPIQGAQVIIRNVERNQTWTRASDDTGNYLFPYLPVGSYQLTVQHPGFAAFETPLTLSVGQSLVLPVRLAIAVLGESVQVSGEVPVVETARTQIAHTILPRDIDSLPLNGRNYLDLALLAPGASRTNTGSSERFAETSAVPGTGISIAGQRNLNNTFVVDGLSSNDDAAGLAGTFYSQEVIREFQVIIAGGIAEFGRASAGAVNIVTQSGTNDWRGRLYGFLRNQRLDARNPLATRKDPLTQSQVGLSLGGPLKLSQTFLFSNFEQTRQKRSGFVTIAPANVTAINTVLDQVQYPGSRTETGEFPTGFDTTNFFARMDHHFGPTNLLSSRYSFYDVSSANARNSGGLSTVSRGTALENRDQAVAISDLATLSSSSIQELRFQFSRSRLQSPVNDLLGPAVNISGVANFGTATFSPTERAIDLYEIVDNFSHQKGAHFFKTGVDFLQNRVDITFPGALQGVYAFSSLANLQAGRYITFQQAFGTPVQFQSNPNLGLFFQDEWRPRRDLTVNYGARYDLQWLPDPIQTDRNNFAPRLGIAYAPASQRTVIRVSYGIFFDRTPLRAVSNALQRDGTKYKVAVLSFGQAGAPVFPGVLAAFPASLLTSITTIDTRIRNGYSQQASLQIERQLNRTASLSVAYLHLRGLHLILSRNVNAPTLSAADATRLGVPNLGRPDSRYANVGRFEAAGDSYFDAMTVALNQRAGRWSTLRLSYTLSKALDNAGNFFFSTPQNNFDLRDDRGLSANDQRHRFALSGLLEVPRTDAHSALHRVLTGFQLSYIFNYGSAQPFNIQTGADRNNDTSVNDRPAGVGRNTGKGFNSSSLDLRLSRRFHFSERRVLELLAESFNTLNRTNRLFPNNILGTAATPLPTFGRATSAADPRQIQIGLRMSF